MRHRMLFYGPLALIGLALVITLGGLIVMLLWNWLLPPLFGWPEVGFWQALGLLALCRILFGRFGGRGFPRSRSHRRAAARWEQLTPEERERFRQAMRASTQSADEGTPQ